ncbi:MAG: pilus assembly protein PilM [Aquificota bacterium]|nr:pilus assembly protein PilM [Aquificota bacterium]
MKLGGIFRRSGTGLSVYMTDRFVRVLELGRNKKPVFEPIEIFWEQDDEGSKRQILSRVVETNGLKGKEVVSCIGANEGILKFQKFPVAMSKKDLMEAIDWFIKSETQQIKEETVYDFFFLEREPEDKYIKVVITIARKSSVDRLRDTLRSAGLQPKVIDYEIVDIINYGLYNRLPPPFAILYMDYYESVLTYYGKNTITYNKIDFNYKYYRDVKDTSMLDHFLIEVRNQLVINEISNIYLAGPVIGDEDNP